MADYAVNTAFTARDRITGAFRAMGKGAGVFENKAVRSFRNVGRAGSRVGSIIKGIIGAQVITRGIGMLTQGIRTAATEFIAFDQTIVGATARFKDLKIGTIETAETMELLKKSARDVGKVTQFTSTEAAGGLNFFARAGFTSTEAMAALKTQVDLATVAELDLARTSDITSDLLGALGLNAADSATKINNLEKLSNSLGLAANMANVTLEDMFETLKIAAPIATAAGEKMDPLIAITAALGSAGIKGSLGATAIKNAYLNLATNAPKVQKALAGIGLEQANFVNQIDGSLDMVKAMQLIGDATKGLGKVEQLAIFEQIFGKRAVAGATNISKSLSEIELITRALEGDKRISKIADEIRTGLGMQVKILKSGMIELGFKFIQAFETHGRGALTGLIKAVQNFDVDKVLNFAKKAIELFTQWKPVIMGVVAGMIAYNVAVKIMLAIGAIKYFFGMVKAIQAASAAQGIFNVIMAANPIGAIALAIAGLVALLVTLEVKFQIFSKAYKAVKEFFTGAGPSMAEYEAAGRARQAPNAAAVSGTLRGRIDIAGAPEGSTAKDTGSTGIARDIDYRMLGWN